MERQPDERALVEQRLLALHVPVGRRPRARVAVEYALFPAPLRRVRVAEDHGTSLVRSGHLPRAELHLLPVLGERALGLLVLEGEHRHGPERREHTEGVPLRQRPRRHEHPRRRAEEHAIEPHLPRASPQLVLARGREQARVARDGEERSARLLRRERDVPEAPLPRARVLVHDQRPERVRGAARPDPRLGLLCEQVVFHPVAQVPAEGEHEARVHVRVEITELAQVEPRQHGPQRGLDLPFPLAEGRHRIPEGAERVVLVAVLEHHAFRVPVKPRAEKDPRRQGLFARARHAQSGRRPNDGARHATLHLWQRHLGVVVARHEDDSVALREDAPEAAHELRVIAEDRLDGRGRVLGGAREIVRHAPPLRHARSIEVEDVAVEDQRELVAAHAMDELLQHLRDLGAGRVQLLPVPHPEAVAGLELAQVDIGDGHQMPLHDDDLAPSPGRATSARKREATRFTRRRLRRRVREAPGACDLCRAPKKKTNDPPRGSRGATRGGLALRRATRAGSAGRCRGRSRRSSGGDRGSKRA